MYEDEKEENEQPEEETGAAEPVEGNVPELGSDGPVGEGNGNVPGNVPDPVEKAAPEAVEDVPVIRGMSKKSYISAVLNMGGDVPGVNKYRYTAVNPFDYDSLEDQGTSKGNGFIVIDLGLSCIADETIPRGQVELRRRSMEPQYK